MTVIYEDNHIIVVNKTASEIVQGDKTGDIPLSETVKQYLKEKYAKPGNVFLGVTHRLDRPVSGLVVFAKTSKALSRLNEMFRNGEVKKTYWAIVKQQPKEAEGELVHYLVRNEKQNKSYAYDKEVKNSKKAVLNYRLIGHSENYFLLEVDLKTGRHHQIRCQLAKMGCPIKRRFEIRFSTLQSGWKYLLACPQGTLYSSGIQRADRFGSPSSCRQSVEWFRYGIKR